MLANLVLTIHCLMAAAIVTLVLLQHGKGADMGAAFGSGSAGSLFGSSGAANFLSRSTAVCAAIFFATSLALTYVHAPKADTGVLGGAIKDAATKNDTKPDATKPDAIPAPSGTAAPSGSAAPAGNTAPAGNAAPADSKPAPATK